LRFQVRSFVGGDGSRDDWARDTTGTSESGLGRNENVRDVLVLAQEGQVKQDFEWFSVGGHDDELGDTTVKGLGSYGRINDPKQSRSVDKRYILSLAPFLNCL
jgi:hypothetical protein